MNRRDKNFGKRSVSRVIMAALLIVMLSGAMLLSGCKEEKLTLEEMISQNPKVGTEIENSLGDIKAEGVESSLGYSGNKIIVTFKYDGTLDKEEAKDLSAAFEENGDAFEAACVDAIKNISKDTGLAKVKIAIRVLNGDSEEMWSRVYGE